MSAIRARKELREEPEWVSSNRTLTMFTAIILILVTFFILMVARANYDETRHGEVLESLRQAFGILPGGPLAIGAETGLPVDVLGGEEGELVVHDSEMARIRALLAPAIMDRDVRIIHSKGQRIISLSAGLLFQPDSAVINAAMADTLLTFCRIMADSAVPVAIEGHTDNQPPRTEGVADNWDLSADRSLAVLDFFITAGGLSAQRLTALGYAGTKPMYPNSTPDGRTRNNRIDLVLDFDRLKAEDLKNLEDRPSSFNFRGFDFLLRGLNQETNP